MRKNISLTKKKKMVFWIQAPGKLSVHRVLDNIHRRYNNILINIRILEVGRLELTVFHSLPLSPSSMIYVCMYIYACVYMYASYI